MEAPFAGPLFEREVQVRPPPERSDWI